VVLSYYPKTKKAILFKAQQNQMLEGSSSENFHVASIDDNEIYFTVAGGANKKGNVYGLGALSKRFTTSTCAYSNTSQTPVDHGIEEMRETIQKLNVELMAKDAKERTLEEKMEHMTKNHEQQSVRNTSVSLSPTLTRNEKVEHYIRIKTHKPIALRFWVESGVSVNKMSICVNKMSK